MTDKLDRRAFLALSGAAVAATAMPRAPMPTKALPGAEAPIAVMPSWAVGQGDSWNWQPIQAATEHDARITWMDLTHGVGGECEKGGPLNAACNCEGCGTYRSLDVERKPGWDGHDVQCGDQHWFNGGMGTNCHRCSEEAFSDFGCQFVAGHFICQDCMTLEDWDAVDPEHAAELRAEMEDEAAA